MTTLQPVAIGDGGADAARLGFGCAYLFRRSARQRRRLLDAAFDAGIRHFDAAPMYGLGAVEREIGRFARGRRDEIVVATKFGIAPRAAAGAISLAQAPIHGLLAAVSSGSKIAAPNASDPTKGAVGRALYRASGFDARAARTGLEQSLRALGTSYIDIFLLHEPRPSDIASDVVEFLDSAQRAGKVRTWGVAGEPRTAVVSAKEMGVTVPVLQIRADLPHRELALGAGEYADRTIWYGVLGRVLPRIVARARSSDDVRRRWNDALGADCTNAGVVADLLLRDALAESASATVLFSTTRPDRVEAAARAAARSDDDDGTLATLRTLVAEDLRLSSGAG